MKNIKNQSFFIAMMVCCILIVIAVVAYAVCGTVVMETSIPSLQRVEINDMSLRYKRDIDARVWLKTRFNIPSQINADPLLGTFVLSTKVDKNVTLRSFTETGYKMSTLDQLMLLQFKMSGIHSGDDKGVMWMRLDGEFKVQVKLAHFPLFPKSVRHVAFTCDVSFKKSDPEEMDSHNCYKMPPAPTKLYP